jgi:hypothetical protein
MIKFFRKIRQKTLTENKFGKYLTYAIGEIVLVVIGILIALSINDWNAIRVEKKDEQQILENLKTEFESAIEQMLYLNKIRARYLSASEEILKISNSNDEYNYQKIDSLLMHTIYSPTYNDPIGSLIALTTSNSIDLISNNDLKVRLIAWPSELQDMIEGEMIENHISTNQYYPILYHYSSMAQIFKWFKITDINFDRDKNLVAIIPSKHINSNYEKLFKNAEFINVLHTRSAFLNISKHETLLLIGKAEAIINTIESELQ